MAKARPQPKQREENGRSERSKRPKWFAGELQGKREESSSPSTKGFGGDRYVGTNHKYHEKKDKQKHIHTFQKSSPPRRTILSKYIAVGLRMTIRVTVSKFFFPC
ncbi:hypothetical protein Ancab_002946 [Ancistrocladus abbreviatus]